jgi:chromosome segregation ATPase
MLAMKDPILATCGMCEKPFHKWRPQQRFCSKPCKTKYHNMKVQINTEALLNVSSEADDLKEQNGRLQKDNELLRQENERWKDAIRRHHNERDNHLEKIEQLEDTIKERDKAIERLKTMERLLTFNHKDRHSTFTREHLETIFVKEIRRQFPNNAHIQEHIGAIRDFNASYINALVAA